MTFDGLASRQWFAHDAGEAATINQRTEHRLIVPLLRAAGEWIADARRFPRHKQQLGNKDHVDPVVAGLEGLRGEAAGAVAIDAAVGGDM